MQKNIIILMDGTWDKANETTDGVITPTNVEKLNTFLIKNNQQLTYYDDGVGADVIGLSKLIDGATGLGINDKIIQGYQFIMQNYNTNDNIYLFGFSRGAYTVRYIADFVAHMGLLKLIGNETSTQQFQRVNNYFLQYQQVRNNNSFTINENIANECKIQMLGVWDTVGALGVPLSFLNSLNRDLYEFHDNVLHANVLTGYQALAIDEEREDFQPCLWSQREGIEQVWFAGVHCDIGGGYIACGLSDIALQWMVSAIQRQKTIFIDEVEIKNIKPNPLDKLHNSDSTFPFDILAHKPRFIPDNSLIKTSVKARMEDLALGYVPTNLPANCVWV